jgi:hypothetical protein
LRESGTFNTRLEQAIADLNNVDTLPIIKFTVLGLNFSELNFKPKTQKNNRCKLGLEKRKGITTATEDKMDVPKGL